MLSIWEFTKNIKNNTSFDLNSTCLQCRVISALNIYIYKLATLYQCVN